MINIKIPEIDVSIPVKNIELIPKKTGGIYLFYNDKDELMYIGKASDLSNRIKIHLSSDKGTESIKHNFKRVDCIFVDDPLEREIYETYMINTLKPLLNRDKVITYKTKWYDPQYNLKIKEEQEEQQKRIDEAVENLELL